MLKVRVIPTLLWKNVGLVKGVAFDSWRRVGTVLPAIKVYNTREVDELILLDIAASRERREPDYEQIAEVSSECFVPLTFGGGVNHVDVIRRLLLSGADKVAINSAAFDNIDLIRKASDRFGSQCIVVSIDAKPTASGHYECFSHSGTRATGHELKAWAKTVESAGAGEILITSIERDGTMTGYDTEMIRQVSESVRIPVIASGGAGHYDHMRQALQDGHANAVAAASIFHFTEQTPLEAKHYLATHGIPVRNVNTRSQTPLGSSVNA